ncbi:MAG: LysR substrate-binding domain-containing protein, partial [Boseongicola sp.]|nr:LysR substrate-binding domain-containing protein [Boseongicola sp.]
ANASVVTGNYEELARKLRTREVDLIVGRITTRDTAGLSFEQLYEENVIAVASATHPLVVSGMGAPRDVSRFPIIVTPTGSSVRQSVDDFFFATGVRPRSLLIETLGDGFARRHTMLTQAIWFTPAGLAEHDIEAGTLARLPIGHATLRTVIGLTTRANEALAGAPRQFADIVRGLAATALSDRAK